MNANVPVFSKVSFSCVFSLTQHDVIKSQQVQRYLELVLVEGKTAAAFPALQTSSHRVQKPGPAWLWLFPSTKSRLLTALQQLFIYSRVFLSKDLISGGKIPSVCETSTN